MRRAGSAPLPRQAAPPGLVPTESIPASAPALPPPSLALPPAQARGRLTSPGAPAGTAALAGPRVLRSDTRPIHVLQRQRCLINNKRQFPQTEPGDYPALRAPHLPLTGWEEL